MKKSFMVVICLGLLIICSGITIAQTGDSTAQSDSEADTIYKVSQVDKKPEIKKKPRANYENSYGQCSGQGVVRLRVVLLKTGQIGNVGVVASSQCKIFDDNAIRVAKK